MTPPNEQNTLPDGKTKPNSWTSTFAADVVLDLSGQICPMTFVRTRLALDRMLSGQLLLLRLTGAEPRRSVPANAVSLGHAIVDVAEWPDGSTEVLLRRA